MDYIEYQTRLGLGFDDKDKQHFFVNRIQLFLQGHSEVPFDTQQERDFCYRTGKVCKLDDADFIDWDSLNRSPSGIQRVWLYLKGESFYRILLHSVIFANTYTGTKKNKELIIKEIERALIDSHIQYDVLHDADGIFFFPKGAKELDVALVSQPLEWLNDYPKAHVAFIKALKEYADASSHNASDVADKLRKALETFFQEFFDVDKSLENCKAIYGKYLKEKNVPSEISSNFETLLQAYSNFMNAHAKHHDSTNMNVLEYLLYQTGNIIRLLIIMKREETDNAN